MAAFVLLTIFFLLTDRSHAGLSFKASKSKVFDTANTILSNPDVNMQEAGKAAIVLLNAITPHDEDCHEYDTGARSKHYAFIQALTEEAVAAHPNSSVAVLMAPVEFWDCPIEPRIKAVERGGGSGAVFMMPPGFPIPHHHFGTPTDGSLGSDVRETTIPSCFADESLNSYIGENFAEVVAKGAANSSFPVVVALESLVVDEDPGQALGKGVVGTIQGLLLFGAIFADIFIIYKCATELHKMSKRRKKKGSKTAPFGIKDLVLVTTIANAIFVCLDVLGFIVTGLSGYPTGHGSSSPVRTIAGIGLFFAMGPTANLGFLLVVFAWADAITFTGRTKGGKGGLFKDKKLRYVFITTNSFSWFLETIHTVFYLQYHPLDRYVGGFANLFNTMTCIVQVIFVLYFGRRTISALTSGPASASFITYCSWILMAGFLGGFGLVVLGMDRVPILFLFLFYIPVKYIQVAACFMLLSVVTSSEKKNKKSKKKVAPGTTAAGSSVTCQSSAGSLAMSTSGSVTEGSLNSTINSSSAGSNVLTSDASTNKRGGSSPPNSNGNSSCTTSTSGSP